MSKRTEANRINAQASTGPRRKAGIRVSRQNARTHGLLSKELVFKNDQEREEYDKLLGALRRDCAPVGTLEEAEVEKLAMSLWNERICQILEQRALQNYIEGSALRLVEGFEEYSEPLEELAGGVKSLLPWDCKEIVLRRFTGETTEPGEDEEHNRNNVVIEARLSSGIEAIQRYHKAINRDFYRAIDCLRVLQSDRAAGEGKAGQ